MTSAIALPNNFGQALRFLRKRAHLTQDELGLAVGYSREQVARLENGSRLPDLTVIAALFVPALLGAHERQLIEQFLALAGQTRLDQPVSITYTKKTRLEITHETVAAPLPNPAHQPPAPLLPLIGRAAELAGLLALMNQTRLVTIVGAPGIGKTRLAVEVARVAYRRFADGCAFVSLADTSAPEDVPYAVLRCLAVTPAPQESADEAVAGYLKQRELLLVMDNCEHVLDGVERFAAWLEHAPGLKLLCTSRTPLDLYGEFEWSLDPLALPDLSTPPNLEHWAQIPALQLLVQRARSADPAFTLEDENLMPLATLCAALDGLPLALELAAVRLRDQQPAQLLQQLLAQRGHTRLSSTWLQQSKRNIAERHRTLQAAIGWSVRLLPAALQAVFARLGVFAGGFTAHAAQAVAAADEDALDHLQRANLVAADPPRLRLLETLRAFAVEQLTAAGGWGDVQRLHAVYYASFAQDVFAGLQGDEQAIWMQRALTEHDNCLAALRWALDEAQGDLAVALAGGLWWFWFRRGLFKLGHDLLAAAIELGDGEPTQRAHALNGLASICLEQEDFTAALDYHQQGLALRRQMGDKRGIATVLHNLGLTAFVIGDYAQAAAYLQESIRADPQADATLAWAHLGLIAQEMNDLPQARFWLEQAYARVMEAPESWERAFVLNYFADALRASGEQRRSEHLALESLRIFTALDDSYYLPDAQMTLAQIALDCGEYEKAAALADLALAQYRGRDDPAAIASALLLQAELAWKLGQKQQAAALLDASLRLRSSVKRAQSQREMDQYAALQTMLDGAPA